MINDQGYIWHQDPLILEQNYKYWNNVLCLLLIQSVTMSWLTFYMDWHIVM